MEKERLLAAEILDIFDDFLEQKGIKIPSKDRDGNESEACIYGEDYYALEDEITCLIQDSSTSPNL